MASQAKDQASMLSVQNRLFMGQQQQVANSSYFEAASGGLFSRIAGDNGGFGTGGGFNFADQMSFGGGGLDMGFGNNHFGGFGGFAQGGPSNFGFGFGPGQPAGYFDQNQPFGATPPADNWGQPSQQTAFGLPETNFNLPGPAMMGTNLGPSGYPPGGIEQPPFGAQYGSQFGTQFGAGPSQGTAFGEPNWNQNPQWNQNPNQDWQVGGTQQGWPQDPNQQPINPMASGWGMPGQPADQYSSGYGMNMNMDNHMGMGMGMDLGMNMNMNMNMNIGMPGMQPQTGNKKDTGANKKKKGNKVQPS